VGEFLDGQAELVLRVDLARDDLAEVPYLTGKLVDFLFE
jgi:hypothetical protein